MDAYAVVETGGKQYRVSKDSVIDVELISGEQGEKIVLSDVLAVSDGQSLKVGAPTVEGASITGTIVEQFRDKKVVAFKKKRRKGYKRKVGHRQNLVKIKIEEISAG
ncbi:MAG: 50S ribosomal protein L21 [Spartobacteria bacterium]|nr:50S ribosomal protein L21 [Spartobacteria bacterium]